MYAPGSSKTHIDEFVERVNTGKGKSLVNELMTEMNDACPRIVIEVNNLCPTCQETMVIQSSKAIIACETCGYMASYLDATSNSMSYTDDVEFACFSYKRINHFNEYACRENTHMPRKYSHLLLPRYYKLIPTPRAQVVTTNTSERVNRYITRSN